MRLKIKMLNLASCSALELISISDNFVENFKKVTKLTHKGGGDKTNSKNRIKV